MIWHKQKRGFTLIELLVVIAIIALLLSIIVPALKKARSHAERTVEHSNLRNLGIAVQLYLHENNDTFFEYHTNFLWMSEVGKMIDNIDEIRYSPRTLGGVQDVVSDHQTYGGSQWGSSRRPWLWPNSPDPTQPYQLGSFGLNGWLYSGEHPYIDSAHSNYSFGRSTSIRNPGNTPIVLNSNWVDAWPRSDNAIPAWQMTGDERDSYETGVRGSSGGSSANNFMMGRFVLDASGRGLTNVAYMDNTVATIRLEDLWTLTWHRNYRPNYDPVLPPR